MAIILLAGINRVVLCIIQWHGCDIQYLFNDQWLVLLCYWSIKPSVWPVILMTRDKSVISVLSSSISCNSIIIQVFYWYLLFSLLFSV